MRTQPNTITYKDELLPDKSVRRSYSDGRFEWRWRLPDGRIQWQDSSGYTGTDESLDGRVIKRTLSDGRVLYGREQGYGRTAWGSGTNLVTVNQSSFGGRVGTILAGVGAGMLLGSIVWPPDFLSLAEEEQLREQARHSGNGGGGDGGGDGGPWGGGDDAGGSDFG